MVFFVCDGCNETLKKAKVDLHAAKCRDCYAVSCVDCSQSFPGGKNKQTLLLEIRAAYDGSNRFCAIGSSHYPWVNPNVLIKL